MALKNFLEKDRDDLCDSRLCLDFQGTNYGWDLIYSAEFKSDIKSIEKATSV